MIALRQLSSISVPQHRPLHPEGDEPPIGRVEGVFYSLDEQVGEGPTGTPTIGAEQFGLDVCMHMLGFLHRVAASCACTLWSLTIV